MLKTNKILAYLLYLKNYLVIFCVSIKTALYWILQFCSSFLSQKAENKIKYNFKRDFNQYDQKVGQKSTIIKLYKLTVNWIWTIYQINYFNAQYNWSNEH